MASMVKGRVVIRMCRASFGWCRQHVRDATWAGGKVGAIASLLESGQRPGCEPVQASHAVGCRSVSCSHIDFDHLKPLAKQLPRCCRKSLRGTRRIDSCKVFPPSGIYIAEGPDCLGSTPQPLLRLQPSHLMEKLTHRNRTLDPSGRDSHACLALIQGGYARSILCTALLSDLGPRARDQICFCNDWGEVLARSDRWPPELVVVTGDSSTADEIVRLRRRLPHAAIICWLETPPKHWRDPLELLAKGVDEIVVSGENDDPLSVSGRIQAARTTALAARVLPVFRPFVTPQLLTFMGELLQMTRRPLTVERAAAAYYASRNPAPKWFTGLLPLERALRRYHKQEAFV